MACNCATKEELDKLYNMYGNKTDEEKTLFSRTKRALYITLSILGWIIVFPLMFIYMILFVIWNEPKDRRINVQNFNLLKIFHLKSYARK